MPERASHRPGTPSWVDVVSPELERIVTFYEQLFGWEASEPGDEDETGGYRMFSQDGRWVAGAGPIQGPEQPPAWTTYVTVEDADGTVATATDAGATVLLEPMEVMTAGRMAVLSDPTGAVFSIWEPGEHIGAGLVNEPVSLTWNELRTRDPEAAAGFYGKVFGWSALPFEGMEGYAIWMLGEPSPENGVGGMVDMSRRELPPDVPSHWDVAFAVADADEVAGKADELGGGTVFEPMDTPVGRMAGIQDPTGATFTVVELARQPPG